MKWLWLLLLPPVLVALVLLYVARETPPAAVPLPADATAVLDDARFSPPAGWRWQRLDTDAGEVRWGHAGRPDARAVVMFLPGYSAPLDIYMETFRNLTDAGYAVVGMDWPGQGGSQRGADNPQKIHAQSLDGHVVAATDVLGQLRSLYPNRKLLLVGLSMGAQLGTRLLADASEFEAAALITPAYALYGGRPTAVERTLLRLLDAAGFGERYAPGSTDWAFDMDAHKGIASACSHPNDRTRLFYATMVRDPSIKVGGMSNAFALALVDSGETAQSSQVLDAIDVPVWMPVAGNDLFVDNQTAEAACERLADCSFQRYDNAKHCLFEESDRYYLPFMRDLIGYLDQHAPAVGL